VTTLDSYVAIVFDTYAQAQFGLDNLWKLNREDRITLHAVAVVHMDAAGNMIVSKKQTFAGLRTFVGATAGALIGLLTGPAGMAAGAYAGAAAGLAGDVVKSGERREAVNETEAGLHPNEGAIVAEISERDPSVLETTMHALGARIYRRPKDEMRHNFFDEADPEPQSTGYFADPSA